MIYKVSELENLINEAVKSISMDGTPSNLYNPIHYILSLGGKRLRPLLTLMSANLFKEDVSSAMPVALGVEIFHNFSLLHDDLMDRADRRRGKLTVHKKWNDNVAILSGDAMQIVAYQFIAKAPKEVLSNVLNLFSSTAIEVCEGQQYDMDFENRLDVTEDEYIEMVRLKTAVLIACSLKLGAIVMNSAEDDANYLYDFGIKMGLAYQIKDDLLDVYGNSRVFGKNIGGDILCNKKTFLLINALERTNPAQKEQLIKWINAVDYNPEQKIDAIKNIYDELNLKQISAKAIEKYYLEGLDYLSKVLVSDERKKELITISETLTYREK